MDSGARRHLNVIMCADICLPSVTQTSQGRIALPKCCGRRERFETMAACPRSRTGSRPLSVVRSCAILAERHRIWGRFHPQGDGTATLPIGAQPCATRATDRRCSVVNRALSHHHAAPSGRLGRPGPAAGLEARQPVIVVTVNKGLPMRPRPRNGRTRPRHGPARLSGRACWGRGGGTSRGSIPKRADPAGSMPCLKRDKAARTQITARAAL